jgi:steroid 5-alpha reductase family enzyme
MTEAMSPVALAFAGLAFSIGVVLLTWVASLVQRDASLIDRVWSLSIVGAGWVYVLLTPNAGRRVVAMLLLGSVWALRLSLFISWRNWGHGEDRRYRQIRERNQPNFAWKSLYLVFLLQAVLAWAVSAPFFAGVTGQRPWHALDVVGLALAAFGIVFEAIGDAQMARFKADAAHRGQVMDRGLWRYTRHPNYFGEACVWWGLWLVAMAGGGWGAAWSVLSPLLMTVLLLKVSGVRLLEKDIAERRPAYRDYVARTNAFVPGPPKARA